jgi:hypothetical protein
LRFFENIAGGLEIFIVDHNAKIDRNLYADSLTLSVRLGNRIATQEVCIKEGQSDNSPQLNLSNERGILFENCPVFTGIDQDDPMLSKQLQLRNYPNPFNGQTKICFNLSGSAQVRLEIYDLLGRELGKLCDTCLPAGQHAFDWPNAPADMQRSGVYYYRLSIDGKIACGKMVYLK